MFAKKMSVCLAAALALFLGVSSSAKAFSTIAWLEAGQETYFNVDFAAGRQARVNVTGRDMQATVYDSTGFEVASGSDPGSGAFTLTWDPATPSTHRIVIQNTGDMKLQFMLTTIQ